MCFYTQTLQIVGLILKEHMCIEALTHCSQSQEPCSSPVPNHIIYIVEQLGSAYC